MVAFSRRCHILIRCRDERRFFIVFLPTKSATISRALLRGDTDKPLIATSQASDSAIECASRATGVEWRPDHPQQGASDALRSVHDALASAGARSLRRPPLGPADVAVGR